MLTFLRYLGKLLISIGAGILLFVAWELWGTGIYTQQQQQLLGREFAKQPAFAHPVVNGSYVSPPRWFHPGPGDVVFHLRIPAIHVSAYVVEGVDLEDLAKGPGHYPQCSKDFVKPLCSDWKEQWPGEKGRVIVSGHRTTHSAPFYNLQAVGKGDKILVDTKWGHFTYVYDHTQIVPENSDTIVVPSNKAELVLTTCNPRYSAAQRLVVFANLDLKRSA
jgi:sortase A